ncbi:MAG: nicotinate (nicotinamide) nucleotide adenylyltransferase [Deltaproteobacteria bacterium]|nr:nicotinate (nicotinamide) nucleotide adenylyltransferase [Deltaproteobacteria bacterium]MBW1812607.1 nicotinate (nicotinamide) nucleotide adenylyltransferase [Deltaproteobacteria bacterium]MBW1845745.1 nicotinate (nicotinamide) nucleotide adenylyltransferase [Deltaproteobacteria bacterium]MBW2181266.1 nicotinate (nicotinamide) nucleotide adenylyltransferase [Deltaproteobacteria bacterium]MBW2364093.1 nicotinate (nicotinamide) nucleotide adenylyltransferase [Deltaproteobacteria bacterium]
MRVGLFGGTFNPVHNGHLAVAKEVKDGFPLDRIIFFPSAIPPHKETKVVVNADDRINMLRIAISATPDFSESFAISDIELKRSGPSYTIDTVYQYQSKMADDNQLYLIMGIDAFFEIDTWKSYLELFKIIPIIVMSRPQNEQHFNGAKWKTLETFIQSNISDDYEYSFSEKKYSHSENMPIHIYDVTPIDISATKIRKRIKKGMPVQPMLPPGVEGYIKSKGLYT